MRATMCALFLILLASRVAGQENEHPAASELVRFVVNPWASSGEGASRPRLAKLLAQYCDAVLTVIPHNTPSEHEWLREETETTDLSVIENVLSSVQFSRYTLAKTFAECASHALTLAESPSISPLTEAKLWARLVMTFNGSNDAVIHATRLGLRSATDDPYSFQYLGAVRIALTRAVMGALADIE